MPTLVDSTDGVRIALHDLGGDGPPLVVLHATGLHGRCYAPIAEHLRGSYHVWAPDLRGHGDTATPPGTDLTWTNMAADTLAVADHLDHAVSVRFAGHSMGAAAIVLAELTRPGTVRAAWLFEPIIFPPTTDVGPESRASHLADGARRRREHFASLDQAYEHYRSKPPFSLTHADCLRAYVDHAFRDIDDGVILKCPGDQEARVFEGADMSVFARLGDVAPPVTVVGSGDGAGPADLAPTLADQLGDGRLEQWPDRTHFGPLEDPRRAAGAIRAAVA